MEQELKGVVALITGAGSGIGRATAMLLGRKGAKVAVTELPGRCDLAEHLAAELHRHDIESITLALDLRQTLMIAPAIDRVVRHFGRLDILVNNAGKQLLKPALEIDEEEFDDILGVNLKGAFLCSQAAAGQMIAQGTGCIVNVASQHGVVGNRNRAPYCASKAGLINLSRALAIEWAEHGIRVNSVSPTFVATDANREWISKGEIADEIERGVLLKRPATPDDVAFGIGYLASPGAAMVTGHNLVIDGGWTAR
jgi:2-deoxy-D-gluconate 3-dehydrogenase